MIRTSLQSWQKAGQPDFPFGIFSIKFVPPAAI